MRHEIINHGYDHSQYFQGCGTSTFDNVVTGCGNNAKEAYEDVIEQIAIGGVNVDSLPKKPKGIRKTDKVPEKFLKEEMNEIFWYVSIRY